MPSTAPASFIPSSTFGGKKTGYIFQRGQKGVGYYPDPLSGRTRTSSSSSTKQSKQQKVQPEPQPESSNSSGDGGSDDSTDDSEDDHVESRLDRKQQQQQQKHRQQQQQPPRKRQTQEKDIPLFQRLAAEATAGDSGNNITIGDDRNRYETIRMKRSKDNYHQGGADDSDDDGLDPTEEERRQRKKSKNAPAEMPSNKPVRRLRIDGNNSVKKTRDPRFTSISGELDEKIFNKNYSFLDEYRSDEINKLTKISKKVKSVAKKEELKKELTKMKQEATERRRALNTIQRLDEMKQEERRKVKEGVKKPYFMKNSAMKEVALEERYKDLKKTGKLQKFMAKKRKHNSSKDRKWLPERRSEDL